MFWCAEIQSVTCVPTYHHQKQHAGSGADAAPRAWTENRCPSRVGVGKEQEWRHFEGTKEIRPNKRSNKGL